LVRKALPLFGEPRIPLDEGDIDADMARIGTIKEANKITGGLRKPSKMPEYASNQPADECNVGRCLQEIRGSVCQRCYALTNRYKHANVQSAMQRRFQAIFRPNWTPTMALTTGKKDMEHFRWHDSGDLCSAEHLLNIGTIEKYTPDTQHWLPTREYEVVRAVLREILEFQENLVIGPPHPRQHPLCWAGGHVTRP
jgi:hypothetical protein